MFKLEIKTGGAAFRNEDGDLDMFGDEVRRLLKDVIKKMECLHDSGNIIDINGNRVGSWKYD